MAKIIYLNANLESLSNEQLVIRVQDKDLKALKALCEKNINFVGNIARKFENKGVEYIDLINAGCLGLMLAAKKYQVNCALDFLEFANDYVHEAIKIELEEHDEL